MEGYEHKPTQQARQAHTHSRHNDDDDAHSSTRTLICRCSGAGVMKPNQKRSSRQTMSRTIQIVDGSINDDSGIVPRPMHLSFLSNPD
jgi:hypothetical protein